MSIPEEYKNFKVHCQCFLNKIDSDLNLMRHKFITRRTMSHTEDQNYLVEEQIGACNGMTAIDIPALNEFTLGTFHLQRANIGKTGCNAKACYDWIDPNLLAMTCYKLGCNNKVIEVSRSALLQIEYTMITNLG
eukprot:15365731-Ditylum_brightwellii.AAC.1